MAKMDLLLAAVAKLYPGFVGDYDGLREPTMQRESFLGE